MVVLGEAGLLQGELVAHLVGEEGLTAQASVFERRDAVRAAAELLADGATVAEVEAVADLVVDTGGVVELASVGRGAEPRHTTAELLSVEARAIEAALARVDEGSGVVGAALVERALDEASHLAPDQQAMVRHLVTSGAGVDVVVGRAGSGKTAALAAARRAWELAGYEVLGTSLAARAAKGLEDDAGMESMTLARLMGAIDAGTQALGAGDVVVVDEAGMVGTRTLARVLAEAGRAKAKVVLVGDPRQLPEIEAGGTFGTLARRLGAAELRENRRQREVWERAALDELRDGHPLRALAAFAGAGRVVTAPDMAQAREALVARWREAEKQGEDALMLAVTRRDVDALNVAARRALKDEGLLGDDCARFGELPLAVGDVVVATRNDRTIGVLNGTRGVVEVLDATRVEISTPEGPCTLPASYADAHLAHGYALTIHKAQGATVDRAFVLATDSLTREAGYVAMSRARHGTELFVPSAGVDDDPGCGHEAARTDDPLERVGARLSVSKAKHLALDEYQPALFDPPAREVAAPGSSRRPSVAKKRRPTSGGGSDAIVSTGGLDPAPADLVAAMGRPPAFEDEREEYERVARVVADYRDRYGVMGTDPLGPVPMEAHRRTHYEVARRELRAYERRLGRARELPGLDLGIGGG